MTINGRHVGLTQEDFLVKPSTWVYKKRWYMLFIFCCACALQGCVWNTWGPIAQSSKEVFSWTDGTIALLPSWGNIMNCITIVPVTWLMDVKGLRKSMIVCSLFLLVGTGLRCIPAPPSTASWLIHCGQILNGIAGTFTFSGPTLISVTWFPTHQRGKATALCALSCYLGIALAFIIGPVIVPEPTDNQNDTSSNHSDIIFSVHWDESGVFNLTSSIDKDALRDSINILMYAECATAGALFLLIIFTFKNKPDLPPSDAEVVSKTGYLAGLKGLIRMPAFWLITLGFSIPTGVYQAWGTVLDVNLNAIDISQNVAGWIGFWTIIAGCVSGFLLAWISDHWEKNLKKIVLMCLVLGVLATTFFTVVVMGYIPSLPYKTVWIYVSCILSGVCLNGAIPIFYEGGIETTHPIAEGITTGYMTFMQNLVGAVFLALLQIHNIGVLWMNWFLVGSICVVIPLMLVYTQRYHKLDDDRQEVVYVRRYIGSDDL